MVHYWNYPQHEAPQAAPPKSGWERLAEAQDEAKRNAQVEPLNPALAQAAAQPATEPFQMGPFIPSAPEPTLAVGPFGYYYYYSVAHHRISRLLEPDANRFIATSLRASANYALRCSTPRLRWTPYDVPTCSCPCKGRGEEGRSRSKPLR